MHREISRFFEAARLAHPPIRGSLSLSLSPIAHSNYAKYRLMNTYGQLLSLIHCCCLLYIKQRPTICPVVDRISAYGEGSNEPLPVPRGVPPLRPGGGGGGIGFAVDRNRIVFLAFLPVGKNLRISWSDADESRARQTGPPVLLLRNNNHRSNNDRHL